MGILNRLKKTVFVTLRIRKYQILSDCKNIEGKPNIYYPTLLKGSGKIMFRENVQLGVINSPGFYEGYNYIEARNEYSNIIIGNNVSINNGLNITSFLSVTIGDNVLIGNNCCIIDTDGHFLHQDKRNDLNPPALPVSIGNNVFIGSNVTILKGVVIGENAVIGNGAVVAKSIPENTIAAGNPAQVIKTF